MLNDDSIDYLEADDGFKGLELFKSYNENKDESNINLIFTYIKMPILNGYEMSGQINKLIQEKYYQKADIIAISSF